jgi:phosphoglycolate phosphatase
MPARELVIFDWDGTLMDSGARIVAAVQSAIDASGLPARDEAMIRAIIGLGMHEAVAALYPDAPDAARERLRSVYETFTRAVAEVPAALFPGATEALDRLEAAGCLLAVATGKSRGGLHRDLDRAGLHGRFVSIRTVDECPSKPHPAMVEEILHECGMEADSALVVGDTLFDLEMAANAGVGAIAVSWGAHPVERLQSRRPLGILGDFAELDRWVLEHHPADAG